MLNETQRKILTGSRLFRGVEAEKIDKYLEETGAARRRLRTGDVLVAQGESLPEVCLVLSGAARGEKLTADGRGIIVNEFFAGDFFGAMLSGAEKESPVTVSATADGEIISLPYAALIAGVPGLKPESERVLKNLINEISQKYFGLMKRLDMLLCPTLRGKIAMYLLEEGAGKTAFQVSHSREEQARLLNCDRSALSRELSRMQKEGLIAVSGRRVEILGQLTMNN